MGLSLFGCGKKPVSEWSDQEIEEWFTSSSWKNELSMQPDSSINIRLFTEQNILNASAWEAAYNFLKETDLDNIQPGRYDLDKSGTFVTVSDYITKDADATFFEAHRKYVDIQYVPVGKEHIGITSLNDIDLVKMEYDEEKDIMFFFKADETKRLADKRNFLVFFPSDGHMPCLKVEKNEVVRKVVIKIPYIE
ncbi:MAG: YhcH/YjgK/YiaL family protein [Paludibacter sp.]|nr:YhcH/YjgK/YiaL family protein [Paludibacter sp.]